MVFNNWRIGMHIQQDAICLVALRYLRSRWELCRWWHITLPPQCVHQGVVMNVAILAKQLQSWRQELPIQHQVSIALPAHRTLQKRLPYSPQVLRDSEQATWMAGVMAQQLEMPASALCVDYATSQTGKEWQITAAQQADIDKLRQLADYLKLRVVAIAPDASALMTFLPLLPAGPQGLVWRNENHWLWATQEQWGCLSCSEVPLFSQLSPLLKSEPLWRCAGFSQDEPSFDPWSIIHRLQPPLPTDGDRFAIALGLAAGGDETWHR